MPVNYIDPWEGRVPSLKDSSSSSATPAKNQNSGIVGDFVDALQQGAYQSAAGDSEAIGQVTGSDTFKNIGKALTQRANSQSATMTDEAQQALSQHIFKDDPDSFTGVAFDDGATNWRTWALQFGALAGQVAGTVATGFGAGTVVKFGAKQVIKSVAKKAITKEARQLVAKNAVKEAIRNGALEDVRSALASAPTKEARDAVLNKATSRLGGIANTAVAGSMAAGMRAQQARDEYLGLNADTLNQNPEFQKAYWEIADNPENQGLDTATIHNAAKEMLAEKAATTAFFDEKALLSDFASGAYVPGAGGVIGRGAATTSKIGRFGLGLAQEGAPEAWQGGETQRAVNEAIKEWGDESRDPMANVVRTRWEEGTLGGVFGGTAKVVEGQHVAPSKPIVTVENSPSTGNSTLDSALAQSNADEQSRYDALTGHVDNLSKPSYMRNGEISPALENAIVQFRLDALQQQQAQQRKDGIMQPFDNPVTGNPDEPAFLRSTTFNPTGRDLSTAADIDINSPVQQALIRSQRADASAEAQLAQALAGGDQGRTLYETTLNDEGLVPESRRLPNNGVINLGGTPGDGINSAYTAPNLSRGMPESDIDTTLDVESTRDPRSPVAQAIASAGNESDAVFNTLRENLKEVGKPKIATIPTGGARNAGVMKATNSPVTGDPEMPAYLRQANISDELRAAAQGDTTQTPGGNVKSPSEAGVLSPRNKVVTGNPDEPAYLRQLSTLRVTKKGKPFATQKEAQLASRKTETPVELPTGGFGVVDKAELAQAQESAGSEVFPNSGENPQAPTATVTNDGTKSENIPDSILSAFPDMQVSNEGYLGLNPFTLSEREALKNAGLVQEVKSADGSSYLAVDPEKLWDLRKTRSEELRNTKTEISQEERNRAIENRASSYDRLANEQDELGDLGDKELAAKYRAKAEEIRQRKSTSQPNADQAAVTPSPDTVTPPVVATDSQPTPAPATNNLKPTTTTVAETVTPSPAVNTEVAASDTNPIVEHTTKRGKVLRGVIAKGLTLEQAKEIDPYTFPKDGGHFIREQHLDKLPTSESKNQPTEEAAATTEAEGATEKQAAPKEQFADNKLFTADRVAAARARMKSKMGNLNSGLDPEMLVDGMTIAGAYIESGIRDFTAYAKSMTDDFGDGIKPFLLSFWEGARNYPGLDTKGMTSVEDSAKQHAELMSKKAETKAKPEADNKAGTERQILRDGIHSKMANGELISNNNTLKRVAAELLGISTGDLSTLQLKEAQEAYEVAAVRHRRDTIISTFNEGGSVKVAFDLAVSDYEAQPNLDVRTAKSSDMQAYSTPTPMALLANIAADVWSGKTVFEPTAGNGLLLLTADSKTTYANELDTDRADSLAWSGFNVTVQDATNNPLEGMIPAKVDAVVANPPFGKYRDDNGKPARVEFEDNQGRAYSFGEIDHIIAKNALDGMKDDGKATLILGAPKEAGDYTGNNKVFLNWLYSNYNVVHHIEANGDLYKGQGAGWPTQMIVIHGRRASGTGKYAPIKGQVQRLATWDAIYDSFNEKGLLDTTGRFDRSRAGTGDVRTAYEPDTDGVGRAARPDGFTAVPVSGTGTGRSAQSEPATGSVERSGRRGRGKAAAGTFDSQPDIGSDGLGETESAPATTRKGSGSRAKPDDLGLSGQRNDRPVGRTVQTKALDTKVDKANEFQAIYKTASGGLNQGVLTPLNMASYTQKALMDIQERHGGVDQYVADRLGYPSTEALHQAFMGLQADAVALGVDAVEKGRAIIIGDQTGVGKGRQAAGMIRYALQKGMIPIFVTQKPNLFTDMYDDLADIGVKDFTPLIMNDENGFVTKTDKATDKVTRLFNHSASKRAALLDQVRSTGKLPDGFNALFLTYSQISSDNNGSKASVLSSVMENAMLIMDESHTAAGQDSKLGQFFKGAVQSAKGVTYLSATYAKRPDNMGLYIRTDLGLAVDNFDRLQSIINNGGLGMQIYIAGKLAEAGQMVRRERSFDGIEIRNRVMADKTGKTAEDFDQVTEVLRGIQYLSSAWRFYVENELSDQIQMESGLDTRIAGNQADAKINVTLFSSVVHNYIAQLSLGLKAKLAAQQAIAAIKEGKRPVIAVENTMGSALDTFMERNNLRMEDYASGLSYTSLLKTIADDVLSYSVKEPGAKKGRRVTMKINDVSDKIVQTMYRKVMDQADSLRVDVPASPIDAIRHEVTKAGYTVAEITGRDRMVDYADNAKIIYRPAVEENRRAVVDRFNNNELDVLILNQAGSTGLSLHASEKFRDQKPRHMIVAQPSLDINTFMQMLGRVNRTGQVALPTYDLLWLDLPSEKRPAAILSRKMASLNANTSGNTESATSVESVDLLNPYGNQVVSAFMAANQDMLARYSVGLLKEEEDQAAHFLGKLAVVPSAVQKQIIEQVEAEYKELIDYLDATGQNELNMTEVDLDAKPLAQRVLTEGRKDAGVFSEPAYITQVDAKAQGRAPKWDEVKAELAESSQAEFDEAVATMIADQDFEARLRSRIAKVEKEISDRKANGKKYDQEEKEITNLNARLTEYLNDRRVIERQFSAGGKYAHGAAIRVKLPDAEHAVTGIVTGLTYDHTGGNPAAPSKWRMRVLLADRTRTLPLSLSRARDGIVEGPRQDTEANLKAVFDRAAEMPNRETRYILTGNLVAAQDRASERGRIIPFTTQDGRVIQGMLMPKKFDPNKGVLEKAEITPASGFEWLSKTKDRTLASLGLRTVDNQVVVRRNYNGSGYAIEMPKAVSKGKRYWGAPEMTAIIGEQAVKGNGTFTVKLTEEQAKQVIKVMQGLNPLTLTDQSQIKDYQAMRGVKTPEFSSHDIKFSKRAQAGSAGKGMTKPEAMLAAKEWLRQFKTDVQVKVAKDQAEFNQMLSELGQAGVSDGEIANAAYLPDSKTLLLNASAIQNPARLRQLMRHEILGHHGLEYVIGKGAVNDILQILKNGYNTSKAIRDAVDTVAANYAGADSDTKIKEAFAHYAENRPVDQGALGRLWDRVVSMVKAALVKAGFIKQNEAEQQLDALLKTIAEQMRNGTTNNDPNGGPGNKTYFSKNKNGDTSAYGQAESLLKESGSSLVNWLKQQRGWGLGTLTDLQIDQIYRDITGGAVNRYQKLRTKMEADRNDILLKAETEVDPLWDAMPTAEKAAMSNLMHDATMAKLHPDKSLEENSLYQEVKEKLARAKTEKTKAEYQAELDTIKDNHRNLSERYRLTSKQGKELYQTMRKVYDDQWSELRDAIEQRIKDVMGEGGKALAAQMRLKMEQALKHGPYFPLARFGDYIIRAKKGDQYFREHFEKRRDAEAALKQYRKEGFTANLSVKEQGAGDQANMHALGMDIMEALDKAQAEGTAPSELKDTVWQAMLEMLPDASFAKHAIHRKRTKGASRDGHRAYLNSVYHYAHHVSKIKYGHKMKAELDGMKEQVKAAERNEESSIKADDIEVAQQVLNEMNKRHELNMNPKGSALSGKLGNLGFMFYLGASPAAAVINLTQNFMVMLPQLAGKFGVMKASSFMLKAMGDYIKHGVFKSGTKEAWVSLTRAKSGITADEKAMLNALYHAGALDLTQAHSIAARADTDLQDAKHSAKWVRTGMQWAGSLFHNAEVLNREVAALTAYRLLKEKNPKINMDEAVDQVTEMVYDGHGNYAASNRPRFMRNDVAKVLTQFKIYSQMMTYTMISNAIKAAKGDKAALKTLGVMTGTTFMMAGMMGMPTPITLLLYGIAAAIDDDDDRSWEASFRLGLSEVLGPELGELVANGPLDQATNLNISGRVGMNNLWWRDPKEGTEGDDLTFHYVQQIAGPVLGIGVSAVRGMREFANGDIQRGVEAMSPKAVKDLAKAYRQATEGEQTRNGDSVIDDVGAWNVAMQAMGFSSAQMAKVYSAREYIKGKEKIIEDRRSNLLADYFTAMREQDTDAMQDVMDNIREFNASHNKAEAITGKTLKQSIKSRERSGERTQAGTYLSSKREYLRSEGAFLDSLE